MVGIGPAAPHDGAQRQLRASADKGQMNRPGKIPCADEAHLDPAGRRARGPDRDSPAHRRRQDVRPFGTVVAKDGCDRFASLREVRIGRGGLVDRERAGR